MDDLSLSLETVANGTLTPQIEIRALGGIEQALIDLEAGNVSRTVSYRGFDSPLPVLTGAGPSRTEARRRRGRRLSKA